MRYAQSIRRPRILIVDDERDVLRLLTEFFQSEGFSVDTALDAVEALELLQDGHFDVALVDLVLPGISGTQLISQMKELNIPTTPILMSGYASVDSAIEALKKGVFDYVVKPFDLENLLLTVKRAVDYNVLLTETPYLEHPEAFYNFVTEIKPGMPIREIVNRTLELILLEIGADSACAFIVADESGEMERIHKCRSGGKVCFDFNPEVARDLLGDKPYVVLVGEEVKKLFPSSRGSKPEFVVVHAVEGFRKHYGFLNICGFNPLKRPTEGKLKLFQIVTAVFSTAVENTAVHNELLNAFHQTVQGLIKAIEAKDEYTRGHSERVARYSRELALEAGYPPDFAERIYQAALLHDIGKIGIRLDYLKKPDTLTEEETLLFRAHTEIGKEILLPLHFLHDVVPIVYYHHERWDGTGYPEGLKGEEIPVGARIVCITDAYDAMASSRPYREGLSKELIVEELEKNAGKQFDPELVRIFVKMIREGKLSRGEPGRDAE